MHHPTAPRNNPALPPLITSHRRPTTAACSTIPGLHVVVFRNNFYVGSQKTLVCCGRLLPHTHTRYSHPPACIRLRTHPFQHYLLPSCLSSHHADPPPRRVHCCVREKISAGVLRGVSGRGPVERGASRPLRRGFGLWGRGLLHRGPASVRLGAGPAAQPPLGVLLGVYLLRWPISQGV